MDEFGSQYVMSDGDLSIRLPDQTSLIIDNFTNGDFGIFFNNLAEVYAPELAGWDDTTPRTSFANDSVFQNGLDIANLSEIANAVYGIGPFLTPDSLFL